MSVCISDYGLLTIGVAASMILLLCKSVVSHHKNECALRLTGR